MLKIVTFAILIVTANANCPAITLDKGAVTYDKAPVLGLYPEGTFADGLCQAGFSLFGQSGTICGKDGKWGGELGKCDVSPPIQAFKECSPTYVQNGVVTYETNSDQFYKPEGTKATLTCNPGYRPRGNTEATCGNGEWTPDFDHCVV